MSQQSLNSYLWRYAVKEFDLTKTLSPEQLHLIRESLRMAPSSLGLQPWKFLEVTDVAVRNKLRQAAYDQSQITDASTLFVLCARKTITREYVTRYINKVATVRQVPITSLTSYQAMIESSIEGKTAMEMEIWNTKQVYLALGYLLSTAAVNQIDACPMEGFDKATFNEILGLANSDYTVAVVVTLGFRSKTDNHANLRKVRFDQAEVFEIK